MLRILHTSDWHLGHTLKARSREQEHEAFFAFLFDVVQEQAVDVLLVAGDVFETANPPASAQEAFYTFLATAHGRFPWLDVVVIGGNHDSAARLDAPNPLLRGLGSAARGGGRVSVVGGLPRLDDGMLDLERLVIPVRARGAETVAAWICAVPFLRPADLPRRGPAEPTVGEEPLEEGVAQIYEEVFAEARARRRPGEAIIAMGHCYMAGTTISALSERKILGGNQHALPPSIFPRDVAYAALGHLHKAQDVGAPWVRYSGSPIPLSLAERRYDHQVVLVEIDGAHFAGARAIPVPRRVEILRIPDEGAAPLAEVLAEIARLPAAGTLAAPGLTALPVAPRTQLTLLGGASASPPSVALAPPARSVGAPLQRPLLEVSVLLLAPEPSLLATVMAALEGKEAQLAQLGVVTVEAGDGRSRSGGEGATSLRDVAPEEVFRRCWGQRFPEQPPDDLVAAFHELLDVVQQEQP